MMMMCGGHYDIVERLVNVTCTDRGVTRPRQLPGHQLTLPIDTIPYATGLEARFYT